MADEIEIYIYAIRGKRNLYRIRRRRINSKKEKTNNNREALSHLAFLFCCFYDCIYGAFKAVLLNEYETRFEIINHSFHNNHTYIHLLLIKKKEEDEIPTLPFFLIYYNVIL